MKRQVLYVCSNQHGSVINVALLILILIFLIGIGLNKISTTDVKIASNMKTDMTTFYGADTGLDAAAEMIEQNLACITGFRDTPNATDGLPTGEEIIGGYFYVLNLDFGRNPREDAYIPINKSSGDSTFDEDDADLYYPPNYGDETNPHTLIKVGGASRFSRGSAIQMAAGYEGLGKGAAGGGAIILFDVYAQRIGENNSSAVNFIQWIHILGSSGGCNFE